eukprot:TRINITY_DN8726_c0_g1_i10.p2 TRINITY_DN8726_c0_g1~~TRINITY_DN8726_c0_g1_i10.p2  ORF type:complete len:121 (-),score=27.78 TRINITY_DN8726_c0_g1_i10:787-1149(-)
MGASSCCAKRGDDEEREVSKLPQNVASSGNLRPPPPRPAQSATPGGPEAEEAFPEVGPDSPEFEPQPRGLNSLSIPSLNFSNLRRRPEPDGYSLCLDDSIKPSDFKSVEDDMKAEENETK